MGEIIARDFGRSRYPRLACASGNAAHDVPRVLAFQKAATPERTLPIRELQARWYSVVLPSLWLRWWGVL